MKWTDVGPLRSGPQSRVALPTRWIRERAVTLAGSLFTLYVFLVEPADLAAQSRIIPDAPSCQTCKLDFSLALTFGNEGGPGALPGRPLSVTVDSNGRFWVVAARLPPLVFDRSGRFIRAIGAMGDGPGEWTSPRFAIPAGDSVVVYDGSDRSLNIIGPGFRFVRRVSLEEFREFQDLAVVTWPTAVAMSALSLHQDRAGWPNHVLNVSGTTASVTASFGENGGVLRPPGRNDPPRWLQPHTLLQRRLAVSSGRVWSLDRYQYVISVSTPAGEERTRLRRAASWFTERLREWSNGTSVSAPDPIMAALRVDDAGRAWVLAHVPASNWRDAWTPEMRELNRAPPTAGTTFRGNSGATLRAVSGPAVPTAHSVYHTMIEVLDANGARVLVHRLLEGFVIAVLPDGRLVTYHESALGEPILRVFVPILTDAE